MLPTYDEEAKLLQNYELKLQYYSPADQKNITRMLKKANAPEDGDMLDVGCGDGRAYWYAHRHNMSYVGVDYSAARVAKAKEETMLDIPVSPVFHCADLYKFLPIINGRFSLVFCCEVLEHLKNPSLIWEHIKQRTGIMAVCSVPVNMPHKNHLQVYRNEAQLREAFPGITNLYSMMFDTGSRKRKHFVFTYEPGAA